MNLSRARLRATAAEILKAALEAAAPGPLVKKHLVLRGRTLVAGGVRHPLGRGKVVVVAVGKAAAEMARAAEARLGNWLSSGLAVTTSGAARATSRSAGSRRPSSCT